MITNNFNPPITLLVLTFILCFSFSNAFAEGKRCGSDAICSKGEICGMGGYCIPGCRKSSDCNPGQYCIDNQCTSQTCTPGQSYSCYEAAENTKSVGACRAGIQFCHSDGKGLSACYGQILPQVETCDGNDNDCDGVIDNGLDCQCKPGSKRKCYSGQKDTIDVGECRVGLQYCDMDSSWGKCVGVVYPREEVCDGRDNDCNGKIDDYSECECRPGAIRSCYSFDESTKGVGECQKGSQVCNIQSKWHNECFNEQGPVAETMGDGKDNNCDGEIDNVFFDPESQILDKPVLIEPEPQLEIIE